MATSEHRVILLVEDDEDSRQFMALALRMKGFEVEEASSAERALAQARGRSFDLVLTDYDMPDRNAATMLRQARDEGLLAGVPVLIVTAHPEPRGVDGLPVVRKPVDSDALARQIEHILEKAPPACAEPALEPAAVEPDPDAAPQRPLVEFALYVSRVSPPSQRAQQALARLLARYDPGAVSYRVCDTEDHADDAERDRVVFTPTLVVRRPRAALWILGDLSDPSMVVDLLDLHGIEPTAS